jgi:hypothetical protein
VKLQTASYLTTQTARLVSESPKDEAVVYWAVKIIGTCPDEVPDHPRLGGYQQMLAADILRERYWQDPANPQPIKPGLFRHIGSGYTK